MSNRACACGNAHRLPSRPQRSISVYGFALALAIGSCALSGCVTVKPQDKELLADPAMIYGSGGRASLQEQHVLENREAATSGSTSGGGCGCN